MGRYQCRKEAAQARMRYHRGVTPKEEIRAGQVQFRADREVERALEDELEALKAKVESEKKVDRPKVPKKTKPVKKPKVVKAEVAKKDEHSKDFFEGDD
jgi:hypothetical protein